MIEVKNLLFQPLTLRREAGAGGLHLGPREKAAVPPKQVSEEMRRAERRGLVAMPPQPAADDNPKRAKEK